MGRQILCTHASRLSRNRKERHPDKMNGMLIGLTIGEALKIGTQFYGGLRQHKLLAKQYNARVGQIGRQWTYGVQAMQQQRRDMFEHIVGEIEKVRLNQAKLKGSVMADLNEQYAAGGRTASLIERNMEGDEARAVKSLQDLYAAKNKELNYNLEVATVNRDNQIAAIEKPDHKGLMIQGITNLWSGLFNIGMNIQKLKDSGTTMNLFGRVDSAHTSGGGQPGGAPADLRTSILPIGYNSPMSSTPYTFSSTPSFSYGRQYFSPPSLTYNRF